MSRIIVRQVNRRPLFAAVLSFLMGEILVEISANKEGWWIVAAIYILLGIIASMFLTKATREIRVVFLLLFIIIGLGMVHRTAVLRKMDSLQERMDRYYEKDSQITGVFRIEKSTRTEYGQRLEVSNRSGKYLLYISEQELILAGQDIEITGNMQEINKSANPGGFDAEEYYAGKEIKYAIEIRSYHVVKRWNTVYFLMLLREKMRGSLYRFFSDKQAGILTAMILGDRSGLLKETSILFRKNGIAHILAISGMHVMLIGKLLMKLLEKMRVPKKGAAIIVIAVIGFYGIMTGLAAATVRAIVMIAGENIALYRGRAMDSNTQFAIALIAIFLGSPKQVFSSGVMLSFGAAAGGILAEKIYKVIFDKERFIYIRMPFRKYIKSIVKTIIASVTISLVMEPLIIFYYYEVAPYALMLNFVVVPLLTVVVVSGFLTGIIGIAAAKGSIAYIMGSVSAFPAKFILELYEVICKQVIRIPLSNINPGHISVVELFMWEGFVLITVFAAAEWFKRKQGNDGVDNKNAVKRKKNEKHGKKHEKKKAKKIVKKLQMGIIYCVTCIGLMGAIVFSAWLRNEVTFHTTFLYVGQGDCCIVHIPFEGNYVIDCGSTDRSKVGEAVLIPALKYYGMSEVDAVFVSHADKDHVSGIEEMVEGMELQTVEVRRIYVQNEMDSERINMNDDLRKKMVRKVKRGSRMDGEKYLFLVLSADSERAEGVISNSEKSDNGNDNSMVLLFEYKDIRFLFTGDIEEKGEQMLIEYVEAEGIEGGIDILKCQHHGSKNSLSESFLEWADPKMTVISCGVNNTYGHPAKNTLEKLERQKSTVFRTDLDGAVEIRRNENRMLKIRKWRP